MLSDIGVVGLGVMGENLALNMVNNGFKVAVFNRDVNKVNEFVQRRGDDGTLTGCHTLQQLVDSLARPRIVLLMIKAGAPVDDVTRMLIPLMDSGDIIIDGGNSFYEDTCRRVQYVKQAGMLFCGVGVSGGEYGALHGPSIMLAGEDQAKQRVMPIFDKIAAHVDGESCAAWLGTDGAGHYVKMVHNAIEYGDMQLICETYDIMRRVLGMNPSEIGDVFAQWNQGVLSSYLVEITASILKEKDVDGAPFVDKILDAAGQKGTGRWACGDALVEGVPLTLINEAVFARCLSAQKDQRVGASEAYGALRAAASEAIQSNRQNYAHGPEVIRDLESALYIAKIISYAQGYALMKVASERHGWDLDMSRISLIWRGGCIIRSVFLNKIAEAYTQDASLANILLAPYFADYIKQNVGALRRIAAMSVATATPAPCHAAALSYFDGYTSELLPANLLQAQRDFFGAHGFQRVDKPRDEFFHHTWSNA